MFIPRVLETWIYKEERVHLVWWTIVVYNMDESARVERAHVSGGPAPGNHCSTNVITGIGGGVTY